MKGRDNELYKTMKGKRQRNVKENETTRQNKM